MVFGHTTYRSCLRAELAHRIGVNPAYSLRTFALELEMAHSTLCEILKGKKNISPARALKVARKLELDEKETEYFQLLVRLETTKDPDLKQNTLEKIEKLSPSAPVFDLSLDYFRTISDWYHFPIMEMTHLSNFELSPKNIATRLGISTAEAESAIERLLRLELLEKVGENQFKKTVGHLIASPPGSEPALKRFNEQMLKLALKAIQNQPKGERLTGTETFPIARAQLPEAEKIMEAFFKKMISLSKTKLPKTDIYHLNVQLFNLTPTPLERKKP